MVRAFQLAWCDHPFERRRCLRWVEICFHGGYLSAFHSWVLHTRIFRMRARMWLRRLRDERAARAFALRKLRRREIMGTAIPWSRPLGRPWRRRPLAAAAAAAAGEDVLT